MDRRRGPLAGSGRRTYVRLRETNNKEDRPVAKTTPIEFINQVRAETRKVVWPSRKQTTMTALMVVIMTALLAVFFIGVDTIFEAIVHFLLSLAQ
jgi:preprotein translocase subunit SecE